jgi:PAS domain S-box-containing protein
MSSISLQDEADPQEAPSPVQRSAFREHALGFAPFIVVGVLLAVLWSLVLWFSGNQHRRLIAESYQQLDLLNRATADQMAALMRELRQTLLTQDLWIASRAAEQPGLAALRPAGAALQSSLIETSAQPDAQLPPNVIGSAGIWIGAPVHDANDGAIWRLPVWMQQRAGDPASRGYLRAWLRLDRLMARHEAMRLRPVGSILIAREDGVVLSRTPLVGTLMGANLFERSAKVRDAFVQSEGHFSGDSAMTDGQERIVSHSKVPGFPMRVLVTQSIEKALETFYRRQAFVMTLSAVVSAIALALTWVIWRTGRQVRLQHAELDVLNALSPLGSFRADITGVITHANDAYLRMHGLRPDQLAWGWLDAVPATDRDEARHRWVEAVRQGLPFAITRWLDRPDGQRVKLSIRSRPFFWQGRLAGQVGMAEDITAGAVQERTHRLWTQWLAASNDCVAQLDGLLRVVSLNPAARQRLGLAIDAPLDGVTIDRFCTPGEVERLRDTMTSSLAHRGVWFGESVMETEGGRHYPLALMALAHVTRRGKLEGATLIGRDRSDEHEARMARRDSEDTLRVVGETLSALIVVLDADERIQFVNSVAERRFLLPPVRMLGRRWKDLLGEREYARHEQAVKQALSGESGELDRETSDRDRPQRMHVVYTPLLDEQGAVRGCVGVGWISPPAA